MSAPSDRRPSLQFVFLFGHMANDWCPASLWLLIPAIGLALDLQPSQLGLLISIHAFGAALAYFPAGVIADRTRNQGRLLLMTFWWVGIGYAVASFAPGFWSLALLLAVAGMGDAVWHPIATGVLVRQIPDRRGQTLGIHAVGGTLAEVLSPLLVGLLLTILDWRSTLLVATLPAILMGLAFIWYAHSIPRTTHKRIGRSDLIELKRTWSSSKGLALIAAISTYNMALIALMTITPLFLQREIKFSTGITGILFAAAMLFGAIGQPWVGRLSDTAGRHGVFIAGSILGLTTAIVATLPLAAGWISASLILSMGVLVAIRSGVLAMAVDFSGQREATTLGFVFMVMDGVGALGAVLAGLVGDFQLRYAFLLAAALSIASIIAMLLFYRLQRLPLLR